ncbi:MAG: glycosyltransferase [Candidatus Omnitrophica bacterium]|nr:glycosyltransferase [Candidatus Omnitrophota bacterium]
MTNQPPALSIVIPAYNEEAHIGATLETLFQSLDQSEIPTWEVIVSNDASDDRTVEIAETFPVRIVESGKRNIGGTRNVGAKHATGDYVLFVDADTLVPVETLTSLWKEMEKETVGGGARIEWSEPVSWKGKAPLMFWNTISPLFRAPAGSFLFARREIFEAIGGFNESLFAGEELDLAYRLKKHGPLRILKDPIKTSPRKLQQFSKREILSLYRRVLFSPRKMLGDRDQLDLWYTRRS